MRVLLQQRPDAGEAPRYVQLTLQPDLFGGWELLRETGQIGGRATLKREQYLLQDEANPQRFITVDYWESKAACDAFRQRCQHEFEDLDVRCEEFTVKEREIGRFTPVK